MMPVATKQIWTRVKPETHKVLTQIARKYDMQTSTYLRRIVEKLCGQYEEPLLPNELSHDNPTRPKR